MRTLTTTLCLLLVAASAHARLYEGNPFGMFGGDVYHPSYANPPYYDAENVGVHWTRSGALFAYYWQIDPNPSPPFVYNWATLDAKVADLPATIRPLGNIIPWNEFNYSRVIGGTYFPIDEQRYRDFVRALVERYDGDGVADMPGLRRPIRYWQVANEPDARLRTRFADLQRVTYEEIRAADPFAKVVIGGATAQGPTFLDGWNAVYDLRFVPILNELAGHYVDILDVHWYGANDSAYRMSDSGNSVLDHIRSTLTSAGFSPSLPIWITELGSPSGWPLDDPRSEVEMARDVFKKVTFLGSQGVTRLFPDGMLEGLFNQDGYFDHTGYLYDQRGSNDLGSLTGVFALPKLAYYTYKLMSEKLSDIGWSALTAVHDGTNGDHLYLLRATRGTTPVWIAWWDYFDDPSYVPGKTKNITISAVPSASVVVTNALPITNDADPEASVGMDVVDYSSAFARVTRPVTGGAVTIPLKTIPVIVESSTRSACGNGIVEPGEACDDGNPEDGDGCDNDCHVTLCRGGARIEAALLSVKGIGKPLGSQGLSIQARLVFPPGQNVDLDLRSLGAQIYVAGRGLQTVPLIDVSSATKPVPSGGTGSGCDKLIDGWRVGANRVAYRNRSSAVDPPFCTPGSAHGLKLLSFADRRSTPSGGIKFKVQAKGLSIAGDRSTSEIDDAIRLTVVLGKSRAAGTAGSCATIELSNCSRFLNLTCKAG